MKSDLLEDWLDYIDSNRPLEGEFGLDRLSDISNKILSRPIASKVIVVGGTNGKGTTVEFLSNLIRKSKLKVGAYTSPHLFQFNERIRINNRSVSDNEIVTAFKRIDEIKGETKLTYFDYATLAAFQIFVSESLDVVILEIGIGGRHDPVNLVDSDISILTNVDLDHQAWLGNTIEKIGAEKSEIFRPKKVAILGSKEMPESVINRVHNNGNTAYQLGKDFFIENNGGSWNFINKKNNYEISDIRLTNLSVESAACALVAYGLISNVEVNAKESIEGTSLLGRCDKRDNFVLDVSHNPSSVKRLKNLLKEYSKDTRVIAIIGVMQDKQAAAMIKEINHIVYEWYACSPTLERAMSSFDLKQIILGNSDKKITEFDSVHSAVEAGYKRKGKDIFVVFGSFYTVKEAYESLSSLEELSIR
ncbi:MAG TPA: Mur ligase family protein [SAR86 cluster bacterium]|nr:Mur ligase family protein [SAR86 cluster bacterium]|tara:strand:- start:13538 stop:14791 length:1254 start_codon:yes stop_codon:yes gene_type:complete